MTDETGAFSAPNPPQVNSAGGEELIAFADCELIGINNTMMLVINRQNGNQQIMSPQVLEGLKTCTSLKTLAPRLS